MKMFIAPDSLKQIHFVNLVAEMCCADMLTALLQAPCLDKIYLCNVEVVSDDVMSNALSARSWSGLSKVISIQVLYCSLITAAPFVQWLAMENFSLQYMNFFECERIDYKILVAAAEKCHRALLIEESPGNIHCD